MSTLELEPVDTDRDTDDPGMIHLGYPEYFRPKDWDPRKALCGTMTTKDVPDASEADCIVCVAEAERLGFIW